MGGAKLHHPGIPPHGRQGSVRHLAQHAGTGPEHAQHIHRSMKLPVIGGMTQGEGEALGAFTTSGGTCEAVPDLDLGIHGVMLDNGAAPACTARTALTA